MNIQSIPQQSEIEAALGRDRKGRARRLLRRLFWLVVLLGGLGGFAYWYIDGGAAPSITYKTVEAKPADLVIRVQATGKIQPTTQVEVSSEMSGVVRSVNVDNNSLVKKGDVLAELDIVRFQAQLDRAQASLTAAQARVRTAQATLAEAELILNRAAALKTKGISSSQDMDTALAARDRAAANLAAAQADVSVAQADVELKQTDVDKSRLLSPIDGIVLSRTVEPGQTVASSLQAPVLFTLAEDLTRMQVEADIDEADIGAVQTGQKASFTVDAYPDRTFLAVIETVEFSPKTTDNVVTYTAILRVDNRDLLLRPGMTATAEIVTREIPDALVVPNTALRFVPPKPKQNQGFSLSRLSSLFIPRMPRFETSQRPSGSERTIYVLENGVSRPVNVKIGATDGQVTEIVSGDLKEGDQVIISAQTETQ